MSPEKKSKRQERRARIQQQEKRNRLLTLGLIALGAAFLVFAVVWPQLRPVAEVVSIDPGTHYKVEDNAMGDPGAPITIEEFSDFQCPFCERFHQETERLLRQYYIDTDKVRFVYRSMGNFVSDNIARAKGTPATTESKDAAMAAYCAGDQDKFWDMHAHIFANVLGEDVGSFSDKRLRAIAETTGLDMDQFNSCFDSGKYEDRVQQDYEDGQQAGVNGTPGFVITYTVNGETKTKLIEGAQPFNVFQQELEAALSEIGAPVE
ncbi:MAG TPA: thioredoxin domain-containing protein [Anaerolineales bacterium]|nr:thioredoxin domain-containing protein [Anaerolineales bacterium]